MRRSALAYVPGRSPLHRAPLGASLVFLGSLAAVSFAFSSPLVLAADAAAIAACGIAAGAGRAVRASLRIALPLIALMSAVNALVSTRGETVLLRGWELPLLGETLVTLESLVAGAAIGLRITAVVLVFGVYSACVDPDRVLRAVAPLARHSALTAALVARLVPVAAADLAGMREAAALRGPAAAPVGRAALTRRLVEGSMDRAIDLAATLELRGHSLGAPAAPRRKPSTGAPALLAAGLGVLAVSASALLGGAGSFAAQPSLELDAGAGTLALCAALPLLALAPFVPGRRAGFSLRSRVPGSGPRARSPLVGDLAEGERG